MSVKRLALCVKSLWLMKHTLKETITHLGVRKQDLWHEMTGDVYCEKTKGNECTSTFAWYAIWGSAIEDHPPKERAVRDVLLGPGRPQSSTTTALLPAHSRHVEHLAPPVLPLLQPAVPSWKQKKRQEYLDCRMLNALKSLTQTH